MRKPIDVVVLDEKNVVKIIKINLKSYRIFFWNPKYFRVLELPGGFVRANNIKIGAIINIIFK